MDNSSNAHAPRAERGDAASGDWVHNAKVAIGVALAATILSVFNVVDGNVVQDMAESRAQWLRSAVSIEVEESRLTTLNLRKQEAEQDRNQRLRRNESALRQAKLEPGKGPEIAEAIARRETDIKDVEEDIRGIERQHAEISKARDELRRVSQEAEAGYRALGTKDDLLDVAEAFLAAAIACFGVSAVIRSVPLALMACVFVGLGTVSGMCGMMGFGFPVSGFLVPALASGLGGALGVMVVVRSRLFQPQVGDTSESAGPVRNPGDGQT